MQNGNSFTDKRFILTLKRNIKKFENLSLEKRRFRMRWDSSPERLFFPQKDFQIFLIFEFIGIICDIRV